MGASGVGPSSTFCCPACGYTHPWSGEYAGRSARCACGHVLKVPMAPLARADTAPDAVTAGAALEAAGAGTAAAPPPPDDGNATPAFLRMPSAAPATDDAAVDPTVQRELDAVAKYGEADRGRPDTARDVGVPLVMLGFGGLMLAAQVGYLVTESDVHPVRAAVVVGLETAAMTVAMLVGVLIAAYATGATYGPVGRALVKLVAIYVGPMALGALVTAALGGDMAVGMLGWGVGVVCCWGLTSYLFRLDGQATMATACAMGGAKLVVGLALTPTLVSIAHPPTNAAGTGDGADLTATIVVDDGWDDDGDAPAIGQIDTTPAGE